MVSTGWPSLGRGIHAHWFEIGNGRTRLPGALPQLHAVEGPREGHEHEHGEGRERSQAAQPLRRRRAEPGGVPAEPRNQEWTHPEHVERQHRNEVAGNRDGDGGRSAHEEDAEDEWEEAEGADEEWEDEESEEAAYDEEYEEEAV